jgi:hypothetical protein
MIRRLQTGYKPVGALHSHSDDKPKIRYCQRCNDLFGVLARLGPRIRTIGPDGKIEPPQPGDDQYLTCRNCGSTYPKHETRIEAEIGPIKEPSTGPRAKSQGVEKKPKQRIGRGSNPRLKASKWEIKDEELQRELKDGAQLISYSSSDPLS